MSLRITILGTGTSQGVPVIGCSCAICRSPDPKDQRLRTAALIEKEGKHIVIDAGPDFRQQMLRAKPAYVDSILVTHEHNDHVAGLDDIRPFNFMRRQDMPVYCLPRVAQALRERYPYVFASEPYPGAPMIRLHPIDESNTLQTAGIDVIPILIMHGRLPILGYRIDDFVYLTDVKTIPSSEWSKLQNIDTLVINALHHNPHQTHLNLTEALDMVQRIAPKRAYLTHMSHRMGFHQEVEAGLPEGVHLAYDGLVVEVRGSGFEGREE